jgi:hypothetical protein
MDAKAATDERTRAYGEIVRVRRPGAGVKFVRSPKLLTGDGGKKAGHQDDHV